MARLLRLPRLSARAWRVAVLALALPWLLGAALVLPWRWIAPPVTAFITRDLSSETGASYRWVPLEEISPHLAIAVVAAEDQKFPTHHGFDFASIEQAIREQPFRPRGASTLSQQVAKNLFLWPERSLVRKGLEGGLTVLIETLWPKRRILEVYLNVAEFGPGIFGVGAASARFFDAPPSRVGPEEAARLAAVLPNPDRMSPVGDSPAVRERTARIEASVRALGGAGYLTGL